MLCCSPLATAHLTIPFLITSKTPVLLQGTNVNTPAPQTPGVDWSSANVCNILGRDTPAIQDTLQAPDCSIHSQSSSTSPQPAAGKPAVGIASVLKRQAATPAVSAEAANRTAGSPSSSAAAASAGDGTVTPVEDADAGRAGRADSDPGGAAAAAAGGLVSAAETGAGAAGSVLVVPAGFSDFIPTPVTPDIERRLQVSGKYPNFCPLTTPFHLLSPIPKHCTAARHQLYDWLAAEVMTGKPMLCDAF